MHCLRNVLRSYSLPPRPENILNISILFEPSTSFLATAFSILPFYNQDFRLVNCSTAPILVPASLPRRLLYRRSEKPVSSNSILILPQNSNLNLSYSPLFQDKDVLPRPHCHNPQAFVLINAVH